MSGDADEFDGLEWDAGKSDATFAERGLDFEAAAHLFESDYVEREDLRQDYGERRYVATGLVEGFSSRSFGRHAAVGAGSLAPGQHQIERESIVSTVKRSNEEIRTARGRIDAEKVKEATDADINRWKRQDGVDDAALGPARFVSRGPDVRLLRERLGLSQEAFAERFHLSLRTIQEWEQQRRVPEGPARVLLRVIERNPEAVDRALVS